jgi:hypothetical protein
MKKDWWSYEVCSQHNITQYHFDKQKGRQQITLLGSFDAVASTTPLHQHYVNGSYCELRDSNRSGSVRFICDDKAILPALTAVLEPLTCIYTIQISTRAVCKQATKPTVLPCSKHVERTATVALLQPTQLFDGTYDCQGQHEVSMLVQHVSSLNHDVYKLATRCPRASQMVRSIMWFRHGKHNGVYLVKGKVRIVGRLTILASAQLLSNPDRALKRYLISVCTVFYVSLVRCLPVL